MILTVLLGLACFSSVSMAAEEPVRTRIYICDAGSDSITPWRQTVSRAIARAVSSPLHTKARVMGEAKCGSQAVEFACTAGVFDKGGPILVCSPDTLVRLLRVAAWYALRHAERQDEDYESFRNRQPAPLGMAAFATSAPGRADASVEEGLERIRAEAEANGGEPQDRQGKIFQAIVNMAFAAMFGHEASHLEDASPFCAVADRSRVEESGLWAILIRVTSSGELYKPASPYRTEVVADRCATRRIRLERTLLAATTLSAVDQEFVRRAAADIVSTMLLSHDAGSGKRPVFRVNGAYLTPPLRIIALAGEIGAADKGPMICGGAAENLVEAAQQTFKASPGRGLMPDEIEHTFPKGVIDAWERRGNWSSAVFACR